MVEGHAVDLDGTTATIERGLLVEDDLMIRMGGHSIRYWTTTSKTTLPLYLSTTSSSNESVTNVSSHRPPLPHFRTMQSIINPPLSEQPSTLDDILTE